MVPFISTTVVYFWICSCSTGQPEKQPKTNNPSNGKWNLQHFHAKTLKTTTLLTINVDGICLAMLCFFGRKPIKTYNPKYHQSQTNYQKTGVASPGAVVCLCDDTSKHSLIEVSKSPKTKQDRSCGLMRAEIFRIVPWDLLVQER